jgi:hypothetical protein
MKIRNIIYAVAAMTFAACSSENLDTPQVPLTINATIDGVATRADDSFGEGAQIGVYAEGKENVLFTADEKVNFVSETPIYINSEEMTVKAYFPYSSTTTSKEIKTTDQMALTDYLYAEGKASAVTGKADLVFHHLLSQITLNVSYGEGYDSSQTLSEYKVDLGGLKTKGTFTPPSTVEATGGEDDNIRISCFYESSTALIVIPQQVESFSLTILIDQTEYAATVTVKDGELKANKNYIYNVKIDQEKLTVSSSSAISAWDEKKSDDDVDVVYSGDVTSSEVVTTDHGE